MQAAQPPLSSWHSNVTGLWSDEKVNEAVARTIVDEFMVVLGAGMSTVQVRDAGVRSAFPASVALTSNVWGPFRSPV